MVWPFARRTLIVDPIGWDAKARRVHDVDMLSGILLHHSTCWCRTED